MRVQSFALCRRILTRIPEQSGHPFHGKPATDSVEARHPRAEGAILTAVALDNTTLEHKHF